MKRGTEQKLKFKKLQRRLNLKRWEARGLLDSLWQLTTDDAADGAIGRFSDDDIAFALEWDRTPPEELVEVLIETGWLDRDDEHRLLVHDWSDHCEDSIHLKLARERRHFANGSVPKLTRLTKAERGEIEKHYTATASDAKRTETHNSVLKRPKERTAEAEAEAMPSHALAEAEAEATVEPKVNGAALDLRNGRGSDTDSRKRAGEGYSDTGSTEPPMISQMRTSGERGVVTRSAGRQQFRLVVAKLWAPRGTKQHHSDDTSTSKLFDDHVWPEDADPSVANRVLREAIKLIPEATKRDVPMAWFTERVRKLAAEQAVPA